MGKSVSLATGRAFPTIAAGREYFSNLLKGQELKAAFSGPDAADIRAAYEAYCAKTNWRLDSPPASFHPTQDRGPGYTTRCYGVIFEDGTVGKFSMDKALSAIAN